MAPTDQPTPDILELVQCPFAELGVRDAAALEAVFAQLQAALREEASRISKLPLRDDKAIEEYRVRWLGRSQGVVRAITENWLRSAPGNLKPQTGKWLNELRQEAEQQVQTLDARRDVTVHPKGLAIETSAGTVTVATAGEHLDVTLPGNRRPIGVRHILRQTIDEITRIFMSLGYSVEEGPEIESVYYNFEALNIPEDHPSRDDQDTFYIDRKTVLRTHTSPVQIRTMERQKPPIRIIVPGKVYRNETPDQPLKILQSLEK